MKKIEKNKKKWTMNRKCIKKGIKGEKTRLKKMINKNKKENKKIRLKEEEKQKTLNMRRGERGQKLEDWTKKKEQGIANVVKTKLSKN